MSRRSSATWMNGTSACIWNRKVTHVSHSCSWCQRHKLKVEMDIISLLHLQDETMKHFLSFHLSYHLWSVRFSSICYITCLEMTIHRLNSRILTQLISIAPSTRRKQLCSKLLLRFWLLNILSLQFYKMCDKIWDLISERIPVRTYLQLLSFHHTTLFREINLFPKQPRLWRDFEIHVFQ